MNEEMELAALNFAIGYLEQHGHHVGHLRALAERLRASPSPGLIAITPEVAEVACRALSRDINFAYEMATYWYQKHGPFSSVDKGNAAQDYAKKCEAAIAALSAPAAGGAA